MMSSPTKKPAQFSTISDVDPRAIKRGGREACSPRLQSRIRLALASANHRPWSGHDLDGLRMRRDLAAISDTRRHRRRLGIEHDPLQARERQHRAGRSVATSKFSERSLDRLPGLIVPATELALQVELSPLENPCKKSSPLVYTLEWGGRMDQSPATRQSLIVKLRDPADSGAWSEFVALYEPLVYRLARRKGLQDADAKDLCQEVFRAVAGSIDRWEAGAAAAFAAGFRRSHATS